MFEVTTMSSSAAIKNKTVSTRTTFEISNRAKQNLAKQGLTISEYLRLALIKAANNQVKLVNFLDTPEALTGKEEAESGQIKAIGTVDDFDKWVDKIDEDSKH